MPMALQMKMNTAIVSMNGKYFLPLCPMFSSTIFMKESATSSSIDCIWLGTSLNVPRTRSENTHNPMMMYIIIIVCTGRPNVGSIIS